YVGMGADLALHFNCARSPWDFAADYDFLGTAKLHEIAFPASAYDDDTRRTQSARLNQTENTQPAIAVVALAHLRMLQALGIKADCMAGHSFGELMALHAAGSLSERNTVQLARLRGLACAAASSESQGTMLAVFANKETIEKYVEDLGKKIVIANENTCEQLVLAGERNNILQAQEVLGKHGVKTTELPVSAAFHSSLVAQATEHLVDGIDKCELNAPRMPVYSNKTTTLYPDNTRETRKLLAAQLANPVRFREMIENMYNDGVRTFIEVGPSNVLSRFVSSILGKKSHLVVALDNKRRRGVTAANSAIGALCVHGYEMNLEALWSDTFPEAPQPKPSNHELMLNGANYHKPYPANAISFNDPGFDNRSTLRVLLECTAVTAPVSTVERALATTSTISAANDV
ncbi:ACP S-malonyltransferase, partial [Yoonia sp. R2-816]|uniref:ACP S-malonyltransferase n=1 Tax=Yoonia sp. R2-816 TaxID=3342638 RepID=UPI0037293C41